MTRTQQRLRAVLAILKAQTKHDGPRTPIRSVQKHKAAAEAAARTAGEA